MNVFTVSVHDKSKRSIWKVVIQLVQPGCRSTLFENLSTKSTVRALSMSTQTINRSGTSNLQNQSVTNLYRKSPPRVPQSDALLQINLLHFCLHWSMGDIILLRGGNSGDTKPRRGNLGTMFCGK